MQKCVVVEKEKIKEAFKIFLISVIRDILTKINIITSINDTTNELRHYKSLDRIVSVIHDR